MRRAGGVGTVELVVGVIALAVAIGLIWFAYSAGKSSERTAWQARELKQQQSYAAEIKRLRDEKDKAVAGLQGQLAAAETRFEGKRKEHDNEKAKNARFERDLRDGRIVLVDPGAGKAGGGAGTAGAAPAGGCDGQAGGGGRLSPQLAEFLFAEAARADGLIEDLEEQLVLAQDVITAYYELAKACSRP